MLVLLLNRIKYTLLLSTLLLSVDSLFAQHKVTFSLVPTLGFDVSQSTLFGADNRREYYTLLRPASKKGLHATIGLQAQVLPQWLIAFKYGIADLSGAYTYTTHNPYVYKEYNYKGLGANYMRLAVTTEYTFYTIKFNKGAMKNFKVNLQAGYGLNYTYNYKVNRSDTPFLLPTVSIGNIIDVVGYEVQTKKGCMGINLGLNAQVIYKNHKWLKLGVWYNYIPKPATFFDFTLTNLMADRIDRFRLHVTQHQFLLFCEFPIKLFSL